MLAATSSQGGEASSSTLRLPSVSSQSQACSLLTCAVQHLFFAKGQVYEPIAVLQAKRAREKLADSQRREGLLASGANVGSRRKSDSLVKRQRTRKVDELLLKIQRLSQHLIEAMHQLREYPEQKDLSILIRFGQSRLSCRQQVIISLYNVLSLAPRESALQDSKIRRQKLATLERKLVRFLLGFTNEDEEFAKIIGSPLGLTRTHVFILAPSMFVCHGWSRQRSLQLQDYVSNKDQDGRTDQVDLSDLDHKHQSPPETDPVSQQESISSLEKPVTEAPGENDSNDIDAKRIKRLKQRAQQRSAIKSSKTETGKVRKSSKRQPLSASFSIQCGQETKEELARSANLNWYACKINLKGIA